MILKAVDIREFDFTGYGTYYNMTGDRERVYRTLGEEFEDYMTRTPLIDTPGHLGYTVGMGAPYVLKAMEKHDHTQEALFCAADPVILCVAKARGDEPPLIFPTSKIRKRFAKAFLIWPGPLSASRSCPGTRKVDGERITFLMFWPTGRRLPQMFL